MAEHANKEATYEDVLNAPPGKVAEIVDGELVVTPRPRLIHANAASGIYGDLQQFHRKAGGPRGPGGWQILFEPEFHLRREVLVPDLGGWRRERMPEMLDLAYCELRPDWVCEITSPSTARHDRIAKMTIYRRENIPWVWLVDPADRVVEAFQLRDGAWILAATGGGNTSVRLPPFEAVELELERWWGETPDPDPSEP